MPISINTNNIFLFMYNFQTNINNEDVLTSILLDVSRHKDKESLQNDIGRWMANLESHEQRILMHKIGTREIGYKKPIIGMTLMNKVCFILTNDVKYQNYYIKEELKAGRYHKQ